MNEQDAKEKAQYLIDHGYVVGKEIDELAREILKSINKNVDRGTAIPTDTNTDKEY